jgi:hypothetical protein
VLGMNEWRKEHPKATFGEIEPAAYLHSSGSVNRTGKGPRPHASLSHFVLNTVRGIAIQAVEPASKEKGRRPPSLCERIVRNRPVSVCAL